MCVAHLCKYHRDTDEDLHGQEETKVSHGHSGAGAEENIANSCNESGSGGKWAADVEMIRDECGEDYHNPTQRGRVGRRDRWTGLW